MESLPSNPAARVRFPAGSGILISVLGLGVCPLSVLSCVVFGGGPDIVLSTHSGRPDLVYLSSVLVQRLLLPLQASDPRAFVSPWECKSYREFLVLSRVVLMLYRGSGERLKRF